MKDIRVTADLCHWIFRLSRAGPNIADEISAINPERLDE